MNYLRYFAHRLGDGHVLDATTPAFGLYTLFLFFTFLVTDVDAQQNPGLNSTCSETRTIWSPSDVPAISAENDQNAVELGVKFSSDLDGFICGLRFYKGAINTGTHIGNLWTIGGQLLATATFTNETSFGWQQVNFPDPVEITANTTYIASYHAPAGGYSLDSGYFLGVQQVNFPLRALEDSAGGGNGVYQYGSSGFPSNTYASANYWVDVVFSETSGADTTPPTVVSVTPVEGATGVSLGTSITATFVEAMNPASINASTFELRDSANTRVIASVSYAGVTATLTPTNNLLLANTTYTATVIGGAGGVTDLAGNPLVSSKTWQITTDSETIPPTVVSVTPSDGVTQVSLGTSVIVTFDEGMDPVSINASTFELRDSGNALVIASISYVGVTAILTPTNGPLAPNTNYTATLVGGANGVTDLAGNPMTSGTTWQFTTDAGITQNCTTGNITIWPADTIPTISSENDTNAVELGMKFNSDIDGFICGLRFYKGATNTGTHVGNLWSIDGQLLATATFIGETPFGWQQVDFPNPVPITANTSYVASYHAPAGGYSSDSDYFSGTSQYNSPLRALEDSASGGNGLYQYGAGGFPGGTYLSTNYWVDVVFSGTNGSDVTPPTVVSVTPVVDATGVNLGATVTAIFSEAMEVTSINALTFELRDSGNVLVAATVSYASNTMTLTTTAPLLANTTYTATVIGGGSGVKDLAGNPLITNFSWLFTTSVSSGSDTTPPIVSVTAPANGATVSAVVTLTATATDNVGVIGVQYFLDGTALGSEDTVEPYSYNWNTSTVSNGAYLITAVARDASNNTTVSANVTVNVSNIQQNPPGLVAFYSFEEGSGSIVADGSNNNNTGTISGASWVAGGAIGGALSFDGINDWITVADNPSLDLTNEMTLEAWVKPIALDDWGTVILKESPGELQYALYAHDDASLPVGYVKIDGTSHSAQGSGALPVCTWTHLAITYQGSILRLYKNGVQIGSKTISGDIENSTRALRIGGNEVWGEYFSGLIDEVRVYNRALTSTEIQADMQVASIPSGEPCSSGGNPTINLIPGENSLPGNPPSEWDVQGVGDVSIQGFATDISVNLGETVSFKIDTPSTNYRLDIYRMGYYGGDGARKVATVEPSASLPQNQPSCLTEFTGLMDCGNWAESASWSVPGDATSGIYFAKAIREDGVSAGLASHIVFVVRDDAGNSDVLFQTSDTTWQAYNDYGGNNLYGGSGPGNNGRAYKLSYNRPFFTRDVDNGQDWVFNAEYPMVRWLESNGYNVSYTTGVDSDRRGDLIRSHKLFLSVGHDEYWSGGQRDSVEAARDSGVNLAFFSGNEVFWKVRWENSIDGAGNAYRTLVCYKETHENEKVDPSSIWTGTWRDSRFGPHDGGRPENELTGTIFAVNSGATTSITVPEENGKLPFWRNTSIANLSPGTEATLPFGTLGYEWDVDSDNGFRPSGLIQLSSTTVNNAPILIDNGSSYASGTATHALTLYNAPSGALVFGAGTVQWSWGLDSNHDRGGTPTSLDMQQATVNLFADMGVQPGTLQSDLQPATQQ